MTLEAARLARVLAVYTRVLGMGAANLQRAALGERMAFTESAFFEEARNLERLADECLEAAAVEIAAAADEKRSDAADFAALVDSARDREFARRVAAGDASIGSQADLDRAFRGLWAEVEAVRAEGGES